MPVPSDLLPNRSFVIRFSRQFETLSKERPVVLTEKQRDALTELLNIAFARTAASLSELSGHRVNLDVPEIQMCPIDQLPDMVASLMQEEIATVHQIFSGPVAGDALLMLNYTGAVSLTDLLSEAAERTGRLDESATEPLTEI